MSSWFTHTWTRCPSQRASPVTSRGAQLIGPQRRRIHDQHLTIELDHRPHTDLLAQRVRCVVPVRVNEQADLVAQVNSPTRLGDLGFVLGPNLDPVRQLGGLSRRVLLVDARQEESKALDNVLGMDGTGMLRARPVSRHPGRPDTCSTVRRYGSAAPHARRTPKRPTPADVEPMGAAGPGRAVVDQTAGNRTPVLAWQR